jgi:single-stranded-DNA-specific exonuclease
VRVPEEEVDKNLAGLIANQLASKYARPTLVLRILEDEDSNIVYAGSGRNYSKSRLESLREFCRSTGLVIYAQGHPNAFGIAISEKNFNKFVEVTNEQLKDFDFSPCYFVDLEVTAEQLTDQEVFAIGSNANIWGQGLDEPLIAITDIKIDSNGINYMG